METDDTKGPPRMGTTAEPAANDTEQETAFFAAMDEIVARVTGSRDEPCCGGRDEQIACPCPRGCPDDDAVDQLALATALNDDREYTPEADFPPAVRYRLGPLADQGMLRRVGGGYAITYLGAFHHEALESAERVWAGMAAQEPAPVAHASVGAARVRAVAERHKAELAARPPIEQLEALAEAMWRGHPNDPRPGARGCEADDQGPEDPGF